MSTMIEQVAIAIDKKANYIMTFNKNTTGKELANELAKIAIEVMREIPKDMYDNYRCDEQWNELNSIKVWNKWIDAALKE